MDELQLLKRRFEREQQARKQAETILEKKALELHSANEELIQLNETLEQKITSRTAELERSEKRYRQIIESAKDFIFRTDPEGNFTYVNPVAYQKLGYTSDELIGSHFTMFLLPEFKDEMMEAFIKFRGQKKLDTYQELPIVAKNGDIMWIGQNVQFLIENNEVKEITGVARDISERKIAEDTLATTQLRLTSLITNLHSGVLVEDESRKVVLANRLFCTLFKIPNAPGDLIDTDCRLSAIRSKHLFKNPEESVKRIDQILLKKESIIGEEIHMSDGKILERDYIPIRGGKKHLGHLWQYRDITEKYIAEEKLRRSEEKYRGIIESMELGLMEVDNEQKIQKVYDWFCDMTGYTSEELVGKNADEVFLSQGLKEKMAIQNTNRKKGQAGIYEIQIVKKDGSLIWVLISGAPIINDKGVVTGSIGIHYDITDRKNLQHELEEAKRIAEEAEQAEKQFLARMSHEIRTPLNAIIGISYLMEDTTLSEEQEDYVDSLKSSADILQKLISDILDLSKITAEGMELNPRVFDLVGAVKSLEKTFQLKLLGSPVTIKAEIDPEIKTMMIGDDLLLNQILLNLIGNAVKFTQQGEIKLTVAIKKKEQKIKHIEFSLSDTGIGIQKDQLDAIFENFNQANNEIRYQFGGTGLGLPITKKLVELQGGDIEVASELGVGTTFTVTLLYEDSGKVIVKTQKASAFTDEIKLSISKILIAEDNYMNRKYVAALFKKWDIDHEFAFNGKLAVEAANRKKFDLILMDISMPEMNGYDATIQIRNTSNLNQHTPIVALTASAMVSKKDKAFEVGMTDYLAKPFKPTQLKKLIQKYNRSNDPEQEETIPQMEGFVFDKRLNIDHLEYLYKGDLDYAAEMFELFLDYTMGEYKKLRPLLEQNDLETFQGLAHKLKPNFSLVGLTDLEKKMLQLERLDEDKMTQDELNKVLSEVDKALEIFKPLIKSELDKMKTLI